MRCNVFTFIILSLLLLVGCETAPKPLSDYVKNAGAPVSDKQVVAWYRKLSEQGDARAQNALGIMYTTGRVVAKNDKQAVVWYRKSAEQGYAVAQYNLGVMYENGSGVSKDDKQAVAWYRKSAEQGYVDAQYNLGVMYQNGRGV